MTSGSSRRRTTGRRSSRRKKIALCAAAFAVAVACFLASLRLMEFLRAKSGERFIRGRSGGHYTPAEAAKKATEKIRGE